MCTSRWWLLWQHGFAVRTHDLADLPAFGLFQGQALTRLWSDTLGVQKVGAFESKVRKQAPLPREAPLSYFEL